MDDTKAVLSFIESLSEEQIDFFHKVGYFFAGTKYSSKLLGIVQLLIERGASSAIAIQNELDITEATSYRLLNELEERGYVTRHKIPIRIKGHSGPTPFIWSVPGADDMQVVDAWNEFKMIKALAILGSPEVRVEPLGVDT